jgi:predicted MPP superfamily phosphohydrolase
VQRGLGVALVLLFLGLPLTFWLVRTLPREQSRWVAFAGFSWMGVLFYLVVTVAATDLGLFAYELVARLLNQVPATGADQRLAFSRMMAGGVALFAGGAVLLALRSGLGRFTVRQVEVTLDRLPKRLSGTTIVQLSDVHVGPTIGRPFIEAVVKQVNALEPDVVAITGDLVDGSVDQLREAVAPLAELRAKHGVFFVTGNHEYYSGVHRWCRELSRLGIRVLRNERVSIGDESASFDLAGVDDASAHRFGRGHGADLESALAGRDPERELVLLAHQPRQIHEASGLGVGLQLSGHTHGGQLWPWKYMVRLEQPVVSGLARVGRTQLYVSNGTGYWGPPMRLGAPAEITRITLLAGESHAHRNFAAPGQHQATRVS